MYEKTVSGRHFNKIRRNESQARYEHATNMTLLGKKCLVVSAISRNQKQYKLEDNARCNLHHSPKLNVSYG